MNSYYETQVYPNRSFPFLYHTHHIDQHFLYLLHWHENMELLYMTEGSMKVIIDTQQYVVKQGDLAIINCYQPHFIVPPESPASYLCLIPSKTYCEEFGLPMEDAQIQPVIHSPHITALFEAIAQEFQSEQPFQKTMLKSRIMLLLTELFRHHTLSDPATTSKPQSNKLKIVQSALLYMKQHLNEPISTEQIAQHIGFSKYYFCRLFKEITTYSPVNYLNLLRCKNAQRLLTEGKKSIHEIATLCGFENLSYFTRTYKKYMGVLPLEEKRTAAAAGHAVPPTVESTVDALHGLHPKNR